MKAKHSVVVFVVALAACTDLSLPPGAQVSCNDDADCPTGFLCRADAKRCIDADVIGKTPIAFDVEPLLTPARVSAVDGFSTVTLTATFTEDPVEPARVVATGEHLFACDGTREIVCTLDAADLAEGTLDVLVSARDAAANVAQATLPLVVDHTAPDVADAPPALLEAALENPITRPTAVTVGTTARVTFTTTELLGVEPQAKLAGTELALTRVDADGLDDTAFTFTFDLGGSAAVDDGLHAVELTLQDLVGNARTIEVDVGIVIDTTPPAPPAVDVADRVTYRRAPWGVLGDATPVFSVSGAPAAVAEADVLVEARSQEGDAALILGRALAADDGSFDVALVPIDLPRVFLVAWDAAGNPSAAVRVRDIEWTAGFGGKVLGSRLENPHALFESTRFKGSSLDVDLQEIDPAPLFDDDAIDVNGAGQWRPRRGIAGAPNRGAMAFAFHPGLGQLMLFGGFEGGLFSPRNTTFLLQDDAFVALDLDVTPAPGFASMAYDGRRDRMVVVDGERRTWAFEDGRFRELAIGETGPRGALAYDPVHDVVVGYEADNNGAQTWAFDGTSWTSAALPGPGVRGGHALAFDDTEQRVLLHGGATGGDALAITNDVWALDLTGDVATATWTELVPAGAGRSSPSLRDHASFTGPDGAMWLAGGASSCSPDFQFDCIERDEVWAWRAATSSFELVTVFPAANGEGLGQALGAAWDHERDRLIAIGGGIDPALVGVNFRNAVHVFDGGTWSRGAAPAAIGDRTDFPPLLFDDSRGGLLVVGGTQVGGAVGVRDDTRLLRADDTVIALDNNMSNTFGFAVYDRSTPFFLSPIGPVLLANTGTPGFLGAQGWSPLFVAAPTRSAIASAFDPLRNVSVLFGGESGGVTSNATLLFNGSAFTTITPATTPPARSGATMTFDEGRGVLVMFGGSSLTDTWTFDGTDWSLLTDVGPALREATLVYDVARDALLLVGVPTSPEVPVVFELVDDVWTARDVVGVEGRRLSFSAGYDPVRGEVVLHGGVDASGSVDQTFTWDGSSLLRPALVAQIDLRARGAAADALVTRLVVDTVAGGVGFPDGVASSGASALLWRGRWGVLGENGAGTAAPITVSVTEPAVLSLLDPDVLHVAVVPSETNGTRQGELVIDGFALTLVYREPL